MKRVRATITGRVQGVWFRQSTADEANRLGLAGWVRNNADGSVEAVFEGAPEKVDKMLDWCRVGPPLARVTEVSGREETPEGLEPPFKVTR
jgi:acylphosphatase